MTKLIASILAFLGGSAAAVGTVGCSWILIDEPTMPKSMLHK